MDWSSNRRPLGRHLMEGNSLLSLGRGLPLSSSEREIAGTRDSFRIPFGNRLRAAWLAERAPSTWTDRK